MKFLALFFFLSLRVNASSLQENYQGVCFMGNYEMRDLLLDAKNTLESYFDEEEHCLNYTIETDDRTLNRDPKGIDFEINIQGNQCSVTSVSIIDMDCRNSLGNIFRGKRILLEINSDGTAERRTLRF